MNSTSHKGNAVHLFLLKDGKVIEYQFGNYNSYGNVFNGKITEHQQPDSFEWKMPWSDVCDLMFSSSKSNGIAAILDKFYDGTIPTFRSEGDPNQGWGSSGGFKAVKSPIHTDNFESETVKLILKKYQT